MKYSATIEVVKTISDLFLPVAGEVLEQNEGFGKQPELVNKDPYGEGWLIKIKPAADADSQIAGRRSIQSTD